MGGTGRKLPTRVGYRRDNTKPNKFPNCIGTYPDDCKGVTPDKPGKYCSSCPNSK